MLSPNVLAILRENTKSALDAAQQTRDRAESEVVRLAHALKALDKEIASADGMTPSQNIERIRVFLLANPDKPMKPSEIATGIGMRRSTVHTILSNNPEIFVKSAPESKAWSAKGGPPP